MDLVLAHRQEILLFLATSPHSKYQQEAESNLRFLCDRIARIQVETQAIRFRAQN